MQLELVFAGMEEQQVSTEREVVINNSTLIVKDSSPGKARVVRLISTNPYDYLKPEYMPGAEISL
jgi:hypothetical protein